MATNDATTNDITFDERQESQPNTIEPELELDWDVLREESLKPGGFGERRATLWPRLLGVTLAPDPPPEVPEARNSEESREDDHKHPDERQIKLDTDRSFVLYPVEPSEERDALKEELFDLITTLFRKRRKLSYFQGYHDIMTVISLTVPPEHRLACAEKVSLHRVRDSMGASLEPVLGLLRITKNLIQLADGEYAETLQQTSPLPFYALSNLLTLFSHDMPTLPLIQHVFDYLLSRPPIAVVYLAAVIILSRKCEVAQLEAEGEDGMVHSLLSGLPDIFDEENESGPLEELPAPSPLGEKSTLTAYYSSVTEEPTSHAVEPTTDAVTANNNPNAQLDLSPHVQSATLGSTMPSGTPDSHPNSACDADVPTPVLESRDQYPSNQARSRTRSNAIPPPYPHVELKPKVSLSSLLTRADDLRRTFPPDHPGLGMAKIMGPQSVVYTWREPGTRVDVSEDAEDVEDVGDPDALAEAMLQHPELIVYPYDPASDEVEISKEDPVVSQDYNHQAKRKRRKLHGLRQLDVRTKTILAGAILVLGVAMAAYSVQGSQKLAHSGFSFPSGLYGHRQWTPGRQLVGSAVAGGTMKLLRSLGIGNQHEEL
ncbi:hypothetical protein FA15DRAFT_709065 [Coprinopsis marcescibilis]|uniref:Rab-GAP TBC domain-containing protein n=1 Tax=Coprinopsis marcescibilis TaxID=230819 RepID=A0A5C3KHJ9_COPMA|nr:hypothetical protein FA15DRAFT_709065 [Coprinopsis marcescibilis]